MAIAPKWVLFGSFLLIASPANAEFISGNILYEWCQSNRRLATAYILGVADSAEVENTSEAVRAIGGGPMVCIPPRVAGEQLADIVCRDLSSQASIRHLSAQSLSSISLMLAWPCKKPGP